jgi:alanyl-tRNA synthetase
VDGKGLRPAIEEYRASLGGPGVIVLVGVSDGKAAVAIANTTTQFSAAELIKLAVPAMGGQGGGGKPDFAQGGAPDGSQAQAGVDAVKAALGG